MIYESKFMKFIDNSNLYPKRKTKTFTVVSKTNSLWLLGIIKWDSGWRRYVYESLEEYPSKFDYDCLIDIAKFIKQLMEERKK